MDAICFDGVSKVYPRAPRPAVQDVTLHLPAGQTVVLLGSSGSGKTTLLKMVNRLHDPTSGRVLMDGVDVRELPVTELRRRTGYVIQQIGLFPHWTVARNVATVPEVLRWDRERIRTRVDELLAQVGLPPAEYRDRYPRQLSGGQQQRVGIARALAADPAILLMDEPFGAVDAITRRRLRDEFQRLQRQSGKTVLFVTHDVEEALALADHLAIMDAGRVLQSGTPLEIMVRPANEFVAALIGASEIMRLLGLVDVRSVMEPATPAVAAEPVRPLQESDPVSHALTRLLRSVRDVLPVVDESGAVVGQCSLAGIRDRLRSVRIARQEMAEARA